MNLKWIRDIFKNNDWLLFFTAITLTAIGLVSLYSTTQYSYINFFSKQLVWLALSIVLFFIFSSIDYRFFKVHFFPIIALYFLELLGLIAVFLFGDSVRGAQSWISLGPINIEPVEPLKIILILIFAKYFFGRHVEIYRIKHIVVSGIYVFLPSVLVLLQPDIGSFLMLVVIWLGITIVSGIKLKHILALVLIGCILSVLAWSFLLLDYQKARILTFLNPYLDPYGAGYNSIQSSVAVGSGGFWGKGLGNGTQSQLGFLPEAHTDFIFSSITEELGIVIAAIVLILYSLLFYRMMRITQKASDNFARLTAVGISIMIIFQALFNISMAIGLMPITGLTLPFVSYGGSSLLTVFLSIGILNSIHKNSIESINIKVGQ